VQVQPSAGTGDALAKRAALWRCLSEACGRDFLVPILQMQLVAEAPGHAPNTNILRMTENADNT
jgi:hypothetical protein